MSILPSAVKQPKEVNPKVLLIYGPPKVGKSKAITQLPQDKTLIIDTEEGYAGYQANYLDVREEAGKREGSDLVNQKIQQGVNVSRDDLFYRKCLETVGQGKLELNQLKDQGNFPYEWGVLDTIDSLAFWIERSVCIEHNIENIGDLEWGKGHNMVKERVMKFVNWMRHTFRYSIIVGHLKKREIGGDNLDIVVSPDTLDLSGKLKNLLMSDSDAVGMIHRSEAGELMASFQGDKTESGARTEHLKNQLLPMDWGHIYYSCGLTPSQPVAAEEAAVQ